MENYTITSSQMFTLGMVAHEINVNRQNLEELCASERDDIVYGFELGKIHANLQKLYNTLFHLEKEITLKDKTKPISNNEFSN